MAVNFHTLLDNFELVTLVQFGRKVAKHAVDFRRDRRTGEPFAYRLRSFGAVCTVL